MEGMGLRNAIKFDFIRFGFIAYVGVSLNKCMFFIMFL